MTGVDKRWRNTKIGALAVSALVAKTVADARAAGVEGIEYSWMLETNTEAINGVLACQRATPAPSGFTRETFSRLLWLVFYTANSQAKLPLSEIRRGEDQ